MDEDNPWSAYYEGEDPGVDPADSVLSQAQDAVAPLALDGVDGFYRKGNATVPVATHSGGERSIYPNMRTISVRHENQNMPTFGTAGFRVGGTVYDWARGQITGERPDSPDYRKTGNVPWSALELAYTAPAPAAGSAETITTVRRSLRFQPPLMYYGWAERETRGDPREYRPCGP